MLAAATSGCCGTVAGPTAPAASYAITLQPGELRYFDASTPSKTTQINLTFRFDSPELTVRFRQIDPGCLPGPGDACHSFVDSITPPRPAGVLQFGNTLQPHGDRTRIVLQNPSSDTTVSLTLTIEPRQAGCT
jgi:hypothetical protein